MPRPAKAAAGHFYGILSRFRHSRQAEIQPPPDAPGGKVRGAAGQVMQNNFLYNPFKESGFLKTRRVRHSVISCHILRTRFRWFV